MKLQSRNNKLLYCFFFFLALTLSILILCLFKLKSIAQAESLKDLHQYQSFLIADRLRQSSNALTTMARLYVNTGEEKYKHYYYEILTILHGNSPTPPIYNDLYWYLISDHSKPHHALYEFKSLDEIMLAHQLTQEEYSLLKKVENLIDKLSLIEIKAMNAAEGLFMDASGHYTVHETPNMKLAQTLLFDDFYMAQKALILKPLHNFFNLVNERAYAANLYFSKKTMHIIFLVISLSILSTIAMIFSILQAIKSLAKANEENNLLLLNIFPESIAKRLQQGEQEIVDEYSHVSVIFADLVNFTTLTSTLGPERTVNVLNQLFAYLDRLNDQYQIEKIKTIGDNYMAVCGVPIQTTEHAQRMAHYALAVLKGLEEFNRNHQMNLQLRMGLAYGPVIAGVIGEKKFAYDIWGDTVNLASRLEESALPNTILICEEMALLLKDTFTITPYKRLNLKGIGQKMTYFLENLSTASTHSVNS